MPDLCQGGDWLIPGAHEDLRAPPYDRLLRKTKRIRSGPSSESTADRGRVTPAACGPGSVLNYWRLASRCAAAFFICCAAISFSRLERSS